MIYHTNPDKRRRYDRTDYRRHPFWIQRRPVRIRRTVLAVVVPLVCGVLGYLAMAGRGAFLRMESAMAAWALPCMVLFPVAILSWKNDLFTCRGMAICRYDDRLDLQPKRLIYSYRDRRKGRYDPRYESSVPYSLLDRILYFPDRNFLVLWCGGVDTVYDASGGGCAAYQLLDRLRQNHPQQPPGVPAHGLRRQRGRAAGTGKPVRHRGGALPRQRDRRPEGQTAGKSAGCVKKYGTRCKFFANRLRRPARFAIMEPLERGNRKGACLCSVN